MTSPLPTQPDTVKNAVRGCYSEKWTSTEGRTEIHYFRVSDDEYLFGYNPLLFPDFPIKEFLE